MTIKKLKGIWPVLALPFQENGKVDEMSIRLELDFLVNQGVDGIVLFGLASENYKLSEKERISITDVVISHLNGALPVVVGTEHTGAEVAAERSYIAQEQGAIGVMVYPPTFVKPDKNGILTYYKLISERLRIPVMIQDAQSWTQVPLPPDLLAELAEFPNIRYVKIETVPTGPKMTVVAEKVKGKLEIFGGYGGLHYYEEMERGAVGTLIPAAICNQFIHIHRRFHKGDRAEAERLHQALLPFLVFQMNTLDTLIEIQKILFQKAGVFKTAKCRSPHISLDSYQQATLERMIQKYHF